MARLSAAPSTSMQYYKTYVQPVLMYYAQLVPASPKVQHAYEVAAQRLLHMPHKALPVRFGRLLDTIGLQPMPDPVVFCASAMRRAAERLRPEVQECATMIATARAEVGTMASLADGARQPDDELWLGTAVVDALSAAFARPAPADGAPR